MTLARLTLSAALGAALAGWACGGGDGGGGGTTEPPGPPASIQQANNNQSWYFSNPLPDQYRVTVRDANNRVVPDVPVTWAVTSGDGSVSPANPTSPTQNVTNASGVASATHTLGPSGVQSVTATVEGLATPATFTATAVAPPTNTTAAVDVESISSYLVTGGRFNPSTVALKVNGTVTWTWIPDPGVPEGHNVRRTSGPTPVEGNATTRYMGTHNGTFTSVGRFLYHCNLHDGMTGEVHIVQ